MQIQQRHRSAPRLQFVLHRYSHWQRPNQVYCDVLVGGSHPWARRRQLMLMSCSRQAESSRGWWHELVMMTPPGWLNRCGLAQPLTNDLPVTSKVHIFKRYHVQQHPSFVSSCTNSDCWLSVDCWCGTSLKSAEPRCPSQLWDCGTAHTLLVTTTLQTSGNINNNRTTTTCLALTWDLLGLCEMNMATLLFGCFSS